MRNFVCPKCGLKQRAIGSLVAHRCPMNKNKMTQLEVVEETKNDDNS